MADSSIGSTPQFGTAEYAPQPGKDACKSCNQAVTGQYFRVNGALACTRCVDQLKAQIPKDTHSLFVRGMIFGIGGAILGLILYSSFTIITGIEIGYVSLAVGWLIAKAMKLGSRGIGGRRYQIAAVVFTYAAVSMAAVPIYLSQEIKKEKPKTAHTQNAPAGSPEVTAPGSQPATPGSKATPPLGSEEKPKMTALKAFAILGLLGLASPFLELASPINGAIGLVILLVGMNIAWRLTAGPKIEILGPFPVTAQSHST
jgi:predicted lipid-binding transport protein (Tim44 family)